MKTFKAINPKAKFIFIDSSLQSLTFDEIIYDIACGLCTQFVVVGGKTITIGDSPQLYESEDDFRKGNMLDPYIEQTSGYILHRCNTSIGFADCTTWIYAGGEAKKIQAEERVSIVVCRNGIYEITDSTLPSSLYSSAEDVYEENDYVYIDENGDRHVRKSKYGFLYIDDEQRDVFERFKAIVKEAEEKGIKFVWDNEDGSICALNGKGIDEIVYSVDVKDESKKTINTINCKKDQAFYPDWMGCEFVIVAKEGF